MRSIWPLYNCGPGRQERVGSSSGRKPDRRAVVSRHSTTLPSFHIRFWWGEGECTRECVVCVVFSIFFMFYGMSRCSRFSSKTRGNFPLFCPFHAVFPPRSSNPVRAVPTPCDRPQACTACTATSLRRKGRAGCAARLSSLAPLE